MRCREVGEVAAAITSYWAKGACVRGGNPQWKFVTLRLSRALNYTAEIRASFSINIIRRPGAPGNGDPCK